MVVTVIEVGRRRVKNVKLEHTVTAEHVSHAQMDKEVSQALWSVFRVQQESTG